MNFSCDQTPNSSANDWKFNFMRLNSLVINHGPVGFNGLNYPTGELFTIKMKIFFGAFMLNDDEEML